MKLNWRTLAQNAIGAKSFHGFKGGEEKFLKELAANVICGA